MLKPMPPCSVARYSLTGMVTRPNWIAPRHMDRAMINLPRVPVRALASAHGGRRGREHTTQEQACRCSGPEVPDRWPDRLIAAETAPGETQRMTASPSLTAAPDG